MKILHVDPCQYGFVEQSYVNALYGDSRAQFVAQVTCGMIHCQFLDSVDTQQKRKSQRQNNKGQYHE